MKTKSFLTSLWSLSGISRSGRTCVCLGLGVTALAALGAVTHSSHKLVVHEWGTFTSVQGADGALMDWRPLEISELPKFVYNWSNPGLNRTAAGAFGKGLMLTLQRMETPVIYFYSDEELTAHVSVKFPQGTITEWYPQARQIGPANVKPHQVVAKLDAGVHRIGLKPEFTFASLLLQHAAKDSRIVWSDVRVLPAKQHPEISTLIPFDKSGSHYFAARETDADFVRVDSRSRTNSAPEHERFLFYRGVGRFSTPLTVTMRSEDELTLTNTGPDALRHLFVLRVRNAKGEFLHLDSLGGSATADIHLNQQDRPQPEIAARLADEMAAALVSAGLYEREATAMVNTWTDSWFTEEGLRVLYVLPRAWTDRTLPLEVDPQPREIARVMVGRAEIITPKLETHLRDHLVKAQAGDQQSHAQAVAELKKLGRFAEPAIRRVTLDTSDAKFNQFAWQFLQMTPKSESSPNRETQVSAGAKAARQERGL